MSFWDEFTPTKDINEEPKQKPTDYPHIYLNIKGKYVVYASRLNSKCYVGTFDSIEVAYEAQMNFKQTGQKATKKKKVPLNEELKFLISEYHEQHPT